MTKGKTCFIFIAIIVLTFSSAGFSKSTAHSSRSAAKHKKVRRAPEKASLLPGQSYSVQRGDSLIKIAKDFGITPEAIKTANRLKSSRIKAGQMLNIPVAQSAAVQPAAPSAETRQMSAAPAEDPQSDQPLEPEVSSTRLQLVQAGFQMLGVRYRFGGSGITGFDCSGLVKNLFSKFNIDLPRSSREQFKQGQRISRDQLEVGDLVFFSSGGTQPTHVGIYVGDDKILHAARKARQVIVSDINKIWYKMRYLGARRVMDVWGDDPAPETNE